MVREDTPVRVERDGRTYAVFNLSGQYHVTQDECTHGPGSLGEGWVEGEEVECPFHQGRFHPERSPDCSTVHDSVAHMAGAAD